MAENNTHIYVSPEFKKWKEMVDSVIEFISASRLMLNALTDRLKDGEKFREEEKRRMEDEKIKLEFYKECLKMELNNVVKKTNCQTFTDSYEAGDRNEHLNSQKSIHKFASGVLDRNNKYISRIPRQISNIEGKRKSHISVCNNGRTVTNKGARSNKTSSYAEINQKIKHAYTECYTVR
ncbi:hypothetical protein GWI33_017874 [Rhynchophorus ferrugineus]|uniref:Uncharacterized protein n=1 Tax=Rhynchophorus ferrugineus TaxID=354439 RepID=A0A834HUK5_RHYFE|nr:hypothetical protein GWI33_017874 [Rhynchophorus ferrugineus]